MPVYVTDASGTTTTFGTIDQVMSMVAQESASSRAALAIAAGAKLWTAIVIGSVPSLAFNNPSNSSYIGQVV